MKRESRVGRRGQPTRGRSRGGTSGERKTKTVCHCHEHQTLAPSGAVPRTRPFFGDHKGAINETLGQIQLAALFQVPGECFQDALERPILHLPLKAPMAGLVWWVPIRQIRPLGPGPQNP